MPAKTERHRARKRFGQHFLEPVWAEKVVKAIAPSPDQLFLEIGPGTGAITRPLAARSRAVVACEVDRDLAAALRGQPWTNVRVLEGDFLSMPASAIADALAAVDSETSTLAVESSVAGEAAGLRSGDVAVGSTAGNKTTVAVSHAAVRVAGNLPYNVASPIMFRLLDLFAAGVPFSDATLMLQREVADRLLADPHSRDYGVLTVLVRYRAAVDRLLDLPPGAFRPQPKVRSTVVRLRFHAPAQPVDDPAVFSALVGALFSRRRKTLGNALLAYPALTPEDSRSLLSSLELDPTRRPETMYIDELTALGNAVSRLCQARQRQRE